MKTIFKLLVGSFVFFSTFVSAGGFDTVADGQWFPGVVWSGGMPPTSAAGQTTRMVGRLTGVA